MNVERIMSLYFITPLCLSTYNNGSTDAHLNELCHLNHFYFPTNALNYTNLEVKIYVA